MLFNRFFQFSLAPMVAGTLYGKKKQTLVVGIIFFLSAIWNLTGYLWNYLVVQYFDNNFTYLNIFLAFLCLTITMLLVTKLWKNPKFQNGII